MRARPNLSGDQLVQEYLNRVAAAARHLPKGARMEFVGRTKAQIERQVGAVDIADPGQVSQVLGAMGEPEELVRAERLRIDNKWLKKRGRDEHAPAPTAAAGPAASSTPKMYRPRTYQPRFHRPLNSRWRPATPPPPRPTSQTPGGPDGAESLNGTAPLDGTVLPPGTRVTPGPDPTVPPPWPGDLDALMPPGPTTDGRGPGPNDGPTQTPLDGVWQLARGHLLESVAIVLIGLGGAILPFPFWLAGVLVALFSRLWDGRDKVAALAGPILVDFVGAVLSALFTGGKHNVVFIYLHALHVDTSLWIRLGCVLTAVYLAWRVSKGRRVKTPPWKR
jgi:hypothetical protein